MTRALALSGGGAEGVKHLGAIEVLAEQLWREKGFPGPAPADELLGWDIIAGVSIGSVVGFGLAGGRWEHLRRSISIWKRVVRTRDQLLEETGALGVVGAALFNRRGVYRLQPAMQFLRDYVPWKTYARSPVRLLFGAVDLARKGQPFLVATNLPTNHRRQVKVGYDDAVSWVAGSSAMPGYMELIPWVGQGRVCLLGDGGIRNLSPLRAAIAAGADEVDLVLTSPLEPADPPPGDPLTWRIRTIVPLALSTHTNEVAAGDLEQCLDRNWRLSAGVPRKASDRQITVRVYAPSHRVGDTLDFSPGLFEKRFKAGQEAARRPLSIEQALSLMGRL